MLNDISSKYKLGRSIFTILGLTIITLAIFGWYTFPFIAHVSDNYLGTGDINLYVFNSYNLEYNLSKDLSPFCTELILYPKTTSTLMNTSTWLMSLFSMLFTHKLFGINLYIIFNFVMSLIGAFYLAKMYFKDNYYALLCAIIFTFSSYKTSRMLEHYNLLMTAFLPFLIIYYLKICNHYIAHQRPKTKDILIFLILFVLNFFSSYIITILGIYFMFFHFTFVLFYPKIKSIKKWKLVVGCLGILLIGDLSVQFLLSKGVNNNEGFYFGGNLLSYFIPFNMYYTSTEFITEWQKSFVGESFTLETNLFLGFTLILMIITALVVKSKKPNDNILPIIWVSIILILITLPAIRVGHARLLYSPTSLQHFIPVVQQMRAPTRVICLLVLTLSIFSSYKLIYSDISLFKNKWFKLALIILTIIELRPQKVIITEAIKESDVRTALGKKENDGVLIIPFGMFDGQNKFGDFNADEMSLSKFHSKKMVNGFISRIPQEYYQEAKENYILNSLATQDTVDSPENLERAFESLKEFKINYIMIPKDAINSPQGKIIKSILQSKNYTPEQYEDGVLYDISTK